MQIQVIGRALRRVEHGERLAAEVRVGLGAVVLGEQERQIGVVRVEEIHRPNVVCRVARQHGQPGIQEVVAFVRQLGIVRGKGLRTGADTALQRDWVAVIEHHRHRVLPDVPTLER